VEVTPTAHYMMGGVEFRADAATALPGLFAAGEDTGGVHGANRLGGNGVANSTVFGGIAGDSLARAARPGAALPDPDRHMVEAAAARVLRPLGLGAKGDLNSLRERLLDLMWQDVGIIRDRISLERALGVLETLAEEVEETGVTGNAAFNLAWQERLNVENQILVGRAIAASALARTDSRGAHFRADHPECGPLDQSAHTRVRLHDGGIEVTLAPVHFTRVRPGESLLP